MQNIPGATIREQRKFCLQVQLNQNTKPPNIFKSGSKMNLICKGDTKLVLESIDLAAWRERERESGQHNSSLNYPNRLWEKQAKPNHYTQSEHAEPEGIILVFLPDLLYSAKDSHCSHLSNAAFPTGYHK